MRLKPAIPLTEMVFRCFQWHRCLAGLIIQTAGLHHSRRGQSAGRRPRSGIPNFVSPRSGIPDQGIEPLCLRDSHLPLGLRFQREHSLGRLVPGPMAPSYSYPRVIHRSCGEQLLRALLASMNNSGIAIRWGHRPRDQAQIDSSPWKGRPGLSILLPLCLSHCTF